MTFHPGDKVICIEPSYKLTRNKVYTVVKTTDVGDGGQVIEVDGMKDVIWSDTRFIAQKCWAQNMWRHK